MPRINSDQASWLASWDFLYQRVMTGTGCIHILLRLARGCVALSEPHANVTCYAGNFVWEMC